MGSVNAIVKRPELTPNTWQMIMNTAPILHKSRLFTTNSEEQAAAIMLKGHELGLSLTASFEFVHVVQGKPSISPRGALALIYQCGELAGIKIEDNGKACTVWMKRTNGVEHTASFSMDDAAKVAGLIKSGGAWETYPKQMRQWRAVGFCADVVFPDVLGGMKRADELGATVTEEGDVVEGSWKTVESPKPPQPVDQSALLNQLLEQHGADAIMTANGGMIPATAAEINAVSEKLKAARNGMTLENVEEIQP